MPRVDGREVLGQLRSDPRYQSLPIVVLTTSDVQEDINLAYSLGANSYMTKALTFQQLLKSMQVVMDYWFATVKRPSRICNRK